MIIARSALKFMSNENFLSCPNSKGLSKRETEKISNAFIELSLYTRNQSSHSQLAVHKKQTPYQPIHLFIFWHFLAFRTALLFFFLAWQ